MLQNEKGFGAKGLNGRPHCTVMNNEASLGDFFVVDVRMADDCRVGWCLEVMEQHIGYNSRDKSPFTR